MSRSAAPFLLLCLSAAACSTMAVPGPLADEAPASYGRACEGCVAPACVGAAIGQSCARDGDCCAGYCEENAYVIEWRTCRALLAKGTYCSRDGECACGKCTEAKCGLPPPRACLPVGDKCVVDGDCCAGSYCNNDTYLPIRCATAEAAGWYCYRDSNCQSGSCVNYVCK